MEQFYPLASITDPYFIVSPKVDDEQFYNQRIPKDLKQEEKKCRSVRKVYDSQIYGLYGFAALALENADIAPSITALLRNGPTQVKYTNIPAGQEEDYEDSLINQDCDGIGYYFTKYGLRESGVVGTDCIPNTEVPQSATACVDQEIEYAPKLKGYFEGRIFKADTATLKDALIRFGPVAISTKEYDPLSQGILLGWKIDNEQNYWIIAQYLEGFYIYSETSKDLGTMYDAVVLLGPIQYCLAGQLPDTHYCQCAATDTVCLADPIKTECVKPYIDTKAEICPCPTDKESQQYKDDPRTAKKEIFASGSVRMTIGMIAAVLVLPILTLFF
ncbi:MAG: hypothetical protein EZS28_016593 [Streblomastix strix]|uniref:Uncharacterized protein n=1 Tax=Streblomastix strix TaxID=222440 RepID=A0A5J4VZ05_9EUKA|nr:MAG: hypothetical protein EZS28_016593 [Streblomastix strix]